MSGPGRFLPIILTAGIALAAVTGCSRSMINYQIAESIGTVGEYENNEPVETPKMQAEREQREAETELEEEKQQVYDEADLLAQGYFYDEAIDLLENTEILEGDDRTDAAVRGYETARDDMTVYSGDVVHLNFPNLIVDTSLAIDGDNSSQTYAQNLITLEEFEAILDQLYQNNFILIDIHDLADEIWDGYGDVQMTKADLILPAGKRPLVLSVENLNYASVLAGDGVATRLVLDESGEVAAVYTDAYGAEQTGAYDVVPVLEQFISEHPDFSFRGARGVIGLSGRYGAFGYEIADEKKKDDNGNAGENDGGGDDEEEENVDADKQEIYESNREIVRSIAECLLDDGWTFASEGYSYTYMSDLPYEDLENDLTWWEDTVGEVVGSSDTLMYPYGSEVDSSSEGFAYLLGEGYHYLIGLWASEDFYEVTEEYLRQTRRAVTGYILDNYSSYFTSIFNVSGILDGSR